MSLSTVGKMRNRRLVPYYPHVLPSEVFPYVVGEKGFIA